VSTIDPEQLSEADRHKLLIGSVVPRPIAWTSTVDDNGIRNLAPFSFFTVVSGTPPLLAITVQAPENRDGDKDTLVNIRTTGEFVVNVVSAPLADAMWVSSQEHPAEVDEFALAGVTAQSSVVVAAPRVREALISMECVLDDIIQPGGDSVVIGRITRFHVDDRLLDQRGHIDLATLQPLARLGGSYAHMEHHFELPSRAPTEASSPTGSLGIVG
jgi:flavin reductase (DIM6/NTAB) family NADH-FMN oxidoreductase RutF